MAAKEPAEQVELLDRAVANGWSIEEMRGVVRGDPPITDRRAGSRANAEVLELVQDVARAVLGAAEPLGDGWARVPEETLGRLANALGEERP